MIMSTSKLVVFEVKSSQRGPGDVLLAMYHRPLTSTGTSPGNALLYLTISHSRKRSSLRHQTSISHQPMHLLHRLQVPSLSLYYIHQSLSLDPPSSMMKLRFNCRPLGMSLLFMNLLLTLILS